MDPNSSPAAAPLAPDPPVPVARPRRLFLFESGWQVALKLGTEREFCFMMAPGQNYYHRLLDGEICLVRDDEKLCLACAERRGLIAYEPRTLRESITLPVHHFEPELEAEPPA
jgi:hypothetical protein